MLADIMMALGDVLAVQNLVYLAVGVLAGLIAGAIPGLSITMAIVLTLPFTFSMSAIEGMTTMIGVFVGGLSGGLMSGILLGIPGTPSSVATTFDGFPMARNGKPGLALGLGVWSSFFGGLIGGLVLILTANALGRIGLEFGPWDYFALVLFALTITASLAGDNLVKGLIAGALGLVLVTIGEDEINGVERLTLGLDLRQGFSFLPILIGLFAFSQLLGDVEDRDKARRPMMDAGSPAIRVDHLQALAILARRWVNVLRSSLIGVSIGILPAAGGSVANILAYDQAKKASRKPEEFGKGSPDGVIASESANNATAGGALAILLALGIPGDSGTAVMLGALMIHDLAPGPVFIRNETVLVYSIFIVFLLANFVMVALQAVGLRLFVLSTRVPMYMLAAVILTYCAFGVFALNNVISDIWTLLFFGMLGYLMKVLRFPLAPMILGVVLGDVAELNLNRSLSISMDPTPFVTRPWSLLFLILAVFSAVFPWVQSARRRARWPRFYAPALCWAMAVPLFMMPDVLRPVLAGMLVVAGAFLAWRAMAKPAAEALGGTSRLQARTGEGN